MPKGLEVINASFPKTGTKTIHEALEILGYNVCDAHESVYRHYDNFAKIASGKHPRKEMRAILGPGNQWGYNATCDLPWCGLWDELVDEFPEAKVILVLRDEDKWTESMRKHLQVEKEHFQEMNWCKRYPAIYSFIFNHATLPISVYMNWIRPFVIGPESLDYSGANLQIHTQRYRVHNMYVQNYCDKEKLLTYRLGEGWEPICKFLNKPIPDVPFPHCNRMGSVITELASNPDYKNMLHKTVASLVVRGALYSLMAYKHYEGAFDEHLDATWKIIGAFLLAVYFIQKI